MKYAIGQAWSIKDIDASNARIVIGRIEPAGDCQIKRRCQRKLGVSELADNFG